MDYLNQHKLSGLKVGDKVRIIARAGHNERGWQNSWADPMDFFLFKEGKIVQDYLHKGFQLAFDKSRISFMFPYFSLEKIDEDTNKSLNLNITSTMELSFQKPL